MEKGIIERCGKYRVDIKIRGVRKCATFDTYEEAVIGKAELKAETLKSLTIASLPKPATWTLQEAFDRCSDMVWRGTANEVNSRRNAMYAVNFFGPDKLLTDITAESMDAYIAWLRQLGNSGKTINRKIAAISKLFTFAVRRGRLAAKPYMEHQKEGKGRIRFLTQDEEAGLISYMESAGLYGQAEVVVCLIDTGMRGGELFNLKAQDLIFGETPTIQIWRTKNEVSRAVPMTKRVQEILSRRMEHYKVGKLFPHKRSWFRPSWDVAKKSLGLSGDVQMVPYACRHTFGSRLAQRGVPLRAIQVLMGHKTISMTERYTHMAALDLRDAMKVLEGF